MNQVLLDSFTFPFTLEMICSCLAALLIYDVVKWLLGKARSRP